MRQLNRSTIGDALAATRQPFHDGYFAMYSSVLDAVVTDPTLMMVPIDDHMVHRGDAVFETFKCINGQIYNLAAHLDRLIESAEMIALVSPLANAEVTRLIIETIRAARQPDCLIRLLLSRGPGSLGVNPFDCPRPGLYIVATRLSQPFMALHPDGAHVAISKLGGKANFFAQTKNCNYLLNALVKKEAVDAGVDFMAMCDGAGHLMEGATENMGIVSADGVLAFPRLDGILRGTTMMRVCELAKDLVDDGTLRDVVFTDISLAAMTSAAEFLIMGTTINVVSACTFEGQPVGDGRRRVYEKLSMALRRDMTDNAERLTPVFDT